MTWSPLCFLGNQELQGREEKLRGGLWSQEESSPKGSEKV